jgi:RNA polymerase sigma-70 factor (ECF subfamily)
MDLQHGLLDDVLGARGRFIPGAQVVPWAFAIARRLLIDMHRRGGREVLAPTSDETLTQVMAALDDRADDVAIAKETAQRLSEELARLPENQRVAFELIKQDGLSVAEAAQVLGTTVAAVKLRAHRAYEAMRAALARVAAEDGKKGARG